MGHGLLEALLGWVEAHPLAALALVFAVALGESLFLFGLLIPGALFMFAFGALIGADALPMAATFVAAMLGTLAGDGTSYALGRRYRGRLQALPGFARAPALMTRGQSFLATHGGKAIVLGRLIGALRPIVPTVAGAAGLSVTRFAIMDAIATLVWAPCYILPGVVFGASLELAAQVATRLAVLLVVVASIVWLAVAAARFTLAAGRVLTRRYAERLLAWSRRHRRLGILGRALADPRQPELPALAILAALVMAATALLYWVVWGWPQPAYPGRFDALAFYVTQSLHTPISDGIARVLAEIGSPLIYLPFAAVIGALLALMGNWRAAGHWAAAIGFSALATLLLRWWLAIPGPGALLHYRAPDPLFLAGGGQDLILCATVYGLAGMVLASRQPAGARPYYHAVTIAGVVLIALARLYLGLDWASDLLIGLPVAFVWLNLLMLCFRRQRPRPVRGRPVFMVLAGCLVIAVLLALLPQRPLPEAGGTQPTRPLADWSDDGHRVLDSRIRDIAGRPSAPLNVQAAGDAHALIATLARAGWYPPPRFDAGQPLRWLAPEADIATLAVLPRIHDGRRAGITLVHAMPAAETRRRGVLRLWRSGAFTTDRQQPIWVGMVDRQRVDRRLILVATAADQRAHAQALADLERTLAAAGIGHRRVTDVGGMTQLLFWAPVAGVDAKVAPD